MSSLNTKIMSIVLSVLVSMLILFVTDKEYGVRAQHLIGDHVCKHEEKYNVTVEKISKKNVTQREYVWCVGFPPRCSKYTIKERDVISIEEEERTKIVSKCCPGYKEDTSKTYCIPDCRQCIYGNCTNPNTCTCNPGYIGESCNQTCSKGRWGRQCLSKCGCQHGNPCEPTTGNCICGPSWIGPKCEFSANKIKSTTDNTNLIISDIGRTEDNTNFNFNDIGKTEETIKAANSIIEKNLTHNSQEIDITSSSIKEESTTFHTSYPLKAQVKNEEENHPSKIKDITYDQGHAIIDSDASSLDFLEKSKKNFDGIGKMHQYSVKIRPSSFLLSDDIKIENRRSDNENHYFVIFMISLAVGVFLVLIIISIMSIMIVRYKKQRNLAIKHASIKPHSSATDISRNRLSNHKNIFHTPLPDPPVSSDPPVVQNPVFTLTEDKISDKCSNENEYSNTKNENCDVTLFGSLYDYPPVQNSRSSCSGVSTSEPLYDEIPAWRRPRPVTLPTWSVSTGMTSSITEQNVTKT